MIGSAVSYEIRARAEEAGHKVQPSGRYPIINRARNRSTDVPGPGPELLARTDAQLLLLRRIWLREVAAILQGAPIKARTVPAESLRPRGAAAAS